MLDVTNLIGFGVGEMTLKPIVSSYSTAILSGGGTSITCSKPSDVAEGDLLVAFLNIGTGVVVSYTHPSGWIEVHDSNQRAISYKIATDSEPTSYTFNSSGFGYLVCAIVCFKNSTYHTVGAISASGANPSAPAITTAKNSIVILVGSQSAGTTTSAWSVADTTYEVLVPKFGNTRGDNTTYYLALWAKYYEQETSTGTVQITSGVNTRAQLFSCKGE